MKKVVRASLGTMIIVLLLGIIGLVIQILSVVAGASLIGYIKIINTVYSYLLIPSVIYLYFAAGARGTKKQNMDPTEAGTTSALAYIGSSTIMIIINAIIGLLIVNKILTIGLFRPPESVLATIYLGNTSGMIGVAISAFCGLGATLVGGSITFAIGALGSIYTTLSKK